MLEAHMQDFVMIMCVRATQEVTAESLDLLSQADWWACYTCNKDTTKIHSIPKQDHFLLLLLRKCAFTSIGDYVFRGFPNTLDGAPDVGGRQLCCACMCGMQSTTSCAYFHVQHALGQRSMPCRADCDIAGRGVLAVPAQADGSRLCFAVTHLESPGGQGVGQDHIRKFCADLREMQAAQAQPASLLGLMLMHLVATVQATADQECC